MTMKITPTREKVRNMRKDIENRKEHVGGSDIGTIMGFNEFKSQYTLWAEKTGLIEPENIDDKEPVWWGTNTEELIAKRFCMKTGKRIRKSVYAYGIKEYPFIRCHIDRLVMCEKAGLECKSTDNWKYAYESGEVPPSHYAQCQMYMACTGYKQWYLATHRGNGNFHINAIARNDEFIEQMLQAVEEFWTLVQTSTAPEIDGSESTTGTIAGMYSESNPEAETVNLDSVEDTLIALQELGNQQKNLKELQEKYRNEVKALMKDAEKGETSQFTVSWKADKRGTRQFRMKEKPV